MSIARQTSHKFSSSTRYIGHRVPAEWRNARTRYYWVTRFESVPRASSSRFHRRQRRPRRPFFSPFPSSHQSGVTRGDSPLFLFPLPLPVPRSRHAVRAGALIMRGFRRSRFHSFLRLRHREMIIGTWPMWSVHTRNETTSRRVSSGGARRPACVEGAYRGVGREGRIEERGREKWREGGLAGSRASTRVIRQPRRCRRCRRAPTSTMRLVLSHTQGVSRPHILLLDAARRTPEREREESSARPRAFHEATSERTSERAPRGVLFREIGA